MKCCYLCGADKTYWSGRQWQWYHDQQGNTICKRCYHRTKLRSYLRSYMDIWRLDNPDYMKVWNLEHPDYHKVRYLERLAE